MAHYFKDLVAARQEALPAELLRLSAQTSTSKFVYNKGVALGALELLLDWTRGTKHHGTVLAMWKQVDDLRSTVIRSQRTQEAAEIVDDNVVRKFADVIPHVIATYRDDLRRATTLNAFLFLKGVAMGKLMYLNDLCPDSEYTASIAEAKRVLNDMRFEAPSYTRPPSGAGGSE